jgi:hypothetical protein
MISRFAIAIPPWPLPQAGYFSKIMYAQRFRALKIPFFD